MWRDPLDELIEDLERVVPQAAPQRPRPFGLYSKELEAAVFGPQVGPKSPPREEGESTRRANDITRNASQSAPESLPNPNPKEPLLDYLRRLKDPRIKKYP